MVQTNRSAFDMMSLLTELDLILLGVSTKMSPLTGLGLEFVLVG